MLQQCNDSGCVDVNPSAVDMVTTIVTARIRHYHGSRINGIGMTDAVEGMDDCQIVTAIEMTLGAYWRQDYHLSTAQLDGL